jgi:hypothetical protein
VSAVNQVDEATDFFGGGTTDRTFDSAADTFHTLTTWAVWTLAGPDSDGDGVPNASDNCPAVANAGQQDADSDGVGDACDVCPGSDDNIDTDSDGVPDGCDVCPGGDDNVDTDSDGVPDSCDICPGGDDNVDTDSDGVPDGCDVCPGGDDNVDTDGDGVPDGCDVCLGGDDNVDTDADTVADFCDNCTNDANTPQADSDVDGVGDVCDVCSSSDDNLDSDADTVPDGCDICPGSDDNIDSDGDTVPDGCDVCAPSAGSLIRMTITGEVFSSPAFLAGIVDPGDPINFDIVMDTALPNEAAAPDFLVTNAGDLETFLILDVTGPVDEVSVENATTKWRLASTLDLTAALPNFYASLEMRIDNPANSGLVPVLAGNTYQIGSVNLEPTFTGIVFFNILGVADSPEPNSSNDLVDTDGDAVPDGCDVCAGSDDAVDTDTDGLADGCDNCPVDANSNQEDSDGDGIGDACDATPTANVPGLQGWGLLALVILFLTGSFVMIERRRFGL